MFVLRSEMLKCSYVAILRSIPSCFVLIFVHVHRILRPLSAGRQSNDFLCFFIGSCSYILSYTSLSWTLKYLKTLILAIAIVIYTATALWLSCKIASKSFFLSEIISYMVSVITDDVYSTITIEPSASLSYVYFLLYFGLGDSKLYEECQHLFFFSEACLPGVY